VKTRGKADELAVYIPGDDVPTHSRQRSAKRI